MPSFRPFSCRLLKLAFSPPPSQCISLVPHTLSFVQNHAGITTAADATKSPAFFPTNVALQDVGVITHEDFAQQLLHHFNDFPLLAPTPINISYLASELVGHPDKQFCTELLNSFAFGFDIGYRGPDFTHLSSNLKSATDSPEAIFSCIIKELKSHRIAGPFLHIPLANFRTSPVGSVPKKDGTFRMITDLSSPTSMSINDFISAEESTVSFTGFDAAVDMSQILALVPKWENLM